MDYSDLPKEIVEKIVSQHLDTVPQLLSFSGVCKSWRSAAVLLRCPPVLLVPETNAVLAPLSPAAASKGQTHDLVSLTTLTTPSTTTTTTPPPSITLPLFPSTSKISDFHGQRDRYLRLHQDFLSTFPVIKNGDVEPLSHYDKKSDAHCLASKDGWILRTLAFHGDHRHHLDLYLLNPFTGASIPLPPLKSEYADVQKSFITSSPDNDDCHVVTLSGSQQNLLAWCKVGPSGGSWTLQPRNCLVRVDEYIPEHVSYSGGNLYFAGEKFLWVVHDILKPYSAAVGPAVKAFPFPRDEVVKSFESHNKCCPPFNRIFPHVCRIDGRVHVIYRDYGGDYHGDHLTFHVFKLVADERHDGFDRVRGPPPPRRDDEDDDEDKVAPRRRLTFWEEVRSLDGHAVFIGDHNSFSFSAEEAGNAVATSMATSSILNPNANGIRGDHIYFAMNRACRHRRSFREANLDGVFDLVNQKFQRFDYGHHHDDNMSQHPTFWFIPVPWRSSNSVSKKKKKKKGKKKKKQVRAASQETATSTSSVI